MCLCEESFARRVPFLFLDKIAELFDAIQNSNSKVQTFDLVLKTQMRRFSNSKVVIPKIEEIQTDLNDVKGIMVKNIDSLMKRGENLEILEETTMQLEEEAAVFKGGAQQVKKNILKWHRLRLILIVGAILALIGV